MGNVLKAYRVLNKISQGQMADLLGICTMSYNKKENSIADFTQSEIAKIIYILKLDKEDTFNLFFANKVHEMCNNDLEGVADGKIAND